MGAHSEGIVIAHKSDLKIFLFIFTIAQYYWRIARERRRLIRPPTSSSSCLLSIHQDAGKQGLSTKRRTTHIQK